jgi:hypothetical protein
VVLWIAAMGAVLLRWCADANFVSGWRTPAVEGQSSWKALLALG